MRFNIKVRGYLLNLIGIPQAINIAILTASSFKGLI